MKWLRTARTAKRSVKFEMIVADLTDAILSGNGRVLDRDWVESTARSALLTIAQKHQLVPAGDMARKLEMTADVLNTTLLDEFIEELR